VVKPIVSFSIPIDFKQGGNAGIFQLFFHRGKFITRGKDEWHFNNEM
jgi:hypothetical protein